MAKVVDEQERALEVTGYEDEDCIEEWQFEMFSKRGKGQGKVAIDRPTAIAFLNEMANEIGLVPFEEPGNVKPPEKENPGKPRSTITY